MKHNRADAVDIFTTAVAAVVPAKLMPLHLSIQEGCLHIFHERFQLSELPDIYIIGAGKASAAMATAVEDILGGLVTEGLVVTKYGHALPLTKIHCMEAAHPVPDNQGVSGVAATIELLRKARRDDIILCLLSGGASSLWADVPGGLSLRDVQKTFQLLLLSGATIEEMNVVRKHLSLIKGGQLLSYAPTAQWFSFIISDVPGDALPVIASGPTVPDHSGFRDAMEIISRYRLEDRLPQGVTGYIKKGVSGEIPETLKENDPVFRQVQNRVIGNNRLALDAAAAKAAELKYHIILKDDSLTGDTATRARELVHYAANYKGIKPACMLLGGETTVVVTGSGKGGRNQHMALAALVAMETVNTTMHNEITFLAAGTDGTDGPTEVAGAIADSQALLEARAKQLDIKQYLDRFDAGHFFQHAGAAVITGPTQTNVMDIVVVLIR